MNLIVQLNKLLEPLRTKIKMLVGKAIVSLIDDSKNIQLMQVDLLTDETKDNVERIQNYGFTSHPSSNSEAVILFPSGNRDGSGVIIAVENSQYRLKNLPENGVAVYHKDGHYVKLSDGKIELKQGTAELIIENNEIKITAAAGVTIGGAATLPGTPALTGSFCGLPQCLFTGGPHLSNKVSG